MFHDAKNGLTCVYGVELTEGRDDGGDSCQLTNPMRPRAM
jgi:hypothetical protein